MPSPNSSNDQTNKSVRLAQAQQRKYSSNLSKAFHLNPTEYFRAKLKYPVCKTALKT